MKTDAGRGRLYDALQTLQSRWNEVEPLWTDLVRKDFEEKVWGPLNQLAEESLRAMDRLAQIFRQCRQECAGERGMGELLS